MKSIEKIAFNLIFGMSICIMYASSVFAFGYLEKHFTFAAILAILWMINGTLCLIIEDDFIEKHPCEYKNTQCGKISESPAHTTRLT